MSGGALHERFRARWAALGARLARTAAALAEGDPDVAEDLLQEARIALWESDPAPGEADDEAWLRSCARARMRRFLYAWRRVGRYWPAVSPVGGLEPAVATP